MNRRIYQFSANPEWEQVIEQALQANGDTWPELVRSALIGELKRRKVPTRGLTVELPRGPKPEK